MRWAHKRSPILLLKDCLEASQGDARGSIRVHKQLDEKQGISVVSDHELLVAVARSRILPRMRRSVWFALVARLIAVLKPTLVVMGATGADIHQMWVLVVWKEQLEPWNVSQKRRKLLPGPANERAFGVELELILKVS